ncbi:hypothetical protein BD413DRAFT_554722 [Trametes elegans]|nr:hypothetical protein BD413DRAFT_554722 [Trametes elegans]
MSRLVSSRLSVSRMVSGWTSALHHGSPIINFFRPPTHWRGACTHGTGRTRASGLPGSAGTGLGIGIRAGQAEASGQLAHSGVSGLAPQPRRWLRSRSAAPFRGLLGRASADVLHRSRDVQCVELAVGGPGRGASQAYGGRCGVRVRLRVPAGGYGAFAAAFWIRGRRSPFRPTPTLSRTPLFVCRRRVHTHLELPLAPTPGRCPRAVLPSYARRPCHAMPCCPPCRMQPRPSSSPSCPTSLFLRSHPFTHLPSPSPLPPYV